MTGSLHLPRPLRAIGHSLREHVADGIVHGLGVVFAVAGASALLVWAALQLPGITLAALVPYAAGLILSFAFSAAYNMTLHAPTRAVLRRFDHAAIYLLIAGTYTPMALIGIGGGWGMAVAIAAWSLALVGVVLKLAFFHRWQRLGFVLYLGQGWLGAVAAWPMIQTLPLPALILVVAGGLIYTVGTIFHHRESLRFNRAIWHGHVLAAAGAHYAAVVLVAALTAPTAG